MNLVHKGGSSRIQTVSKLSDCVGVLAKSYLHRLFDDREAGNSTQVTVLCVWTRFLTGDGSGFNLRVRQSSFLSAFRALSRRFSGCLWSSISQLFPCHIHSRALACSSPGLFPFVFNFISHHLSPRFLSTHRKSSNRFSWPVR